MICCGSVTAMRRTASSPFFYPLWSGFGRNGPWCIWTARNFRKPQSPNSVTPAACFQPVFHAAYELLCRLSGGRQCGCGGFGSVHVSGLQWSGRGKPDFCSASCLLPRRTCVFSPFPPGRTCWKKCISIWSVLCIRKDPPGFHLNFMKMPLACAVSICGCWRSRQSRRRKPYCSDYLNRGNTAMGVQNALLNILRSDQ